MAGAASTLALRILNSALQDFTHQQAREQAWREFEQALWEMRNEFKFFTEVGASAPA